jgi:hypothetical protein
MTKRIYQDAVEALGKFKTDEEIEEWFQGIDMLQTFLYERKSYWRQPEVIETCQYRFRVNEFCSCRWQAPRT